MKGILVKLGNVLLVTGAAVLQLIIWSSSDRKVFGSILDPAVYMSE